jgi:uncharacterized Fe-S cluster-containing protein
MHDINQPTPTLSALPGLDCGLCGDRTCEQFAAHLARHPADLKRCVHIAPASVTKTDAIAPDTAPGWIDSLGREFDFILDSLPGDPGPREIILLHNPARVRELAITPGDTLIGRPMGMSCGCPVTHCGVATQVDPVNGVVVWCVTGPLQPRANGFKDLGYYSAQAYEGLVAEHRVEMRIGMRYWFMPRRCMLQWRHSGLVNLINRNASGLQVRLEGLMIG